MPRLGTPLTDLAVRTAKPGPKTRALHDTGGLMLVIQPSGTRSWVLKYRHDGRERRIGLGGYPTIGLADARKQRDLLKTSARVEGQDPHRQRIVERRTSSQRDRSFKKISADWFRKQSKTWAPATIDKNNHHLKDIIGPLGMLPIDAITPADVLDALRKIEARGNAHSAHRTRQIASQVFQYAIASGYASQDPAAALKSALTPVKVKSHAAPTEPRTIGAILTAIDGYQGHRVTHLALRLLPLVFTRSTELRLAHWDEFDLDAAEWRIPAARMKMRRPHLVPLSQQALEILRQAYTISGRDSLVFPGVRSHTKPLSENTFNAALRYLGFDQDTITAHGFRAVASTQLNELGWDPDVIERQMAHADRNKVRAVYNRNDYVLERREMMQAWADRVDALKVGGATRPMAKAKPRSKS